MSQQGHESEHCDSLDSYESTDLDIIQQNLCVGGLLAHLPIFQHIPLLRNSIAGAEGDEEEHQGEAAGAVLAPPGGEANGGSEPQVAAEQQHRLDRMDGASLDPELLIGQDDLDRDDGGGAAKVGGDNLGPIHHVHLVGRDDSCRIDGGSAAKVCSANMAPELLGRDDSCRVDGGSAAKVCSANMAPELLGRDDSCRVDGGSAANVGSANMAPELLGRDASCRGYRGGDIGSSEVDMTDGQEDRGNDDVDHVDGSKVCLKVQKFPNSSSHASLPDLLMDSKPTSPLSPQPDLMPLACCPVSADAVCGKPMAPSGRPQLARSKSVTFVAAEKMETGRPRKLSEKGQEAAENFRKSSSGYGTQGSRESAATTNEVEDEEEEEVFHLAPDEASDPAPDDSEETICRSFSPNFDLRNESTAPSIEARIEESHSQEDSLIPDFNSLLSERDWHEERSGCSETIVVSISRDQPANSLEERLLKKLQQIQDLQRDNTCNESINLSDLFEHSPTPAAPEPERQYSDGEVSRPEMAAGEFPFTPPALCAALSTVPYSLASARPTSDDPDLELNFNALSTDSQKEFNASLDSHYRNMFPTRGTHEPEGPPAECVDDCHIWKEKFDEMIKEGCSPEEIQAVMNDLDNESEPEPAPSQTTPASQDPALEEMTSDRPTEGTGLHEHDEDHNAQNHEEVRSQATLLLSLQMAAQCTTSCCRFTPCLEGRVWLADCHQQLVLGRATLPPALAYILRLLSEHADVCDEVRCTVPMCLFFTLHRELGFEEQIAKMQRTFQTGLHRILEPAADSDQYLPLCERPPVTGSQPSEHVDFSAVLALGSFAKYYQRYIGVNRRDQSDLFVLQRMDRRQVALLCLLRSVDHPYIIRNLWLLKQTVGMVVCMQYEGGTLQEHIQQQQPSGLDVHDFWTYLQQLVSATRFLHQQVHILYLLWTASSVVVAAFERGRVKLADFSAAVCQHLPEDGDEEDTQEDILQNLPPTLVPPEMWRGAMPSAASDVWGIGLLACTMATGRALFADCDHQRTEEQRCSARAMLHHPAATLVTWDPMQLTPHLTQCSTSVRMLINCCLQLHTVWRADLDTLDNIIMDAKIRLQ